MNARVYTAVFGGVFLKAGELSVGAVAMSMYTRCTGTEGVGRSVKKAKRIEE
jgi:hypothetical protein